MPLDRDDPPRPRVEVVRVRDEEVAIGGARASDDESLQPVGASAGASSTEAANTASRSRPSLVAVLQPSTIR
jgi:hypothetical protein